MKSLQENRWSEVPGRLVALGCAFALALVACDNPVEPGEDEEHEPEAMVIVLNGQEIVRYEDGEVTGSITVIVGEETAHLDVRFLDEDGDVLDFEDEEDHWLRVTVADEAIAEFEQDTPGEFGGHVHGEGAGQTTAKFDLMHGVHPNGHPDFTVSDVPIQVTDS